MRNTLIIITIGLLCLCGCTQYNGYIGPIFGSCALVEITEDGVPLEMTDETVMSFQNEVVQIVKRQEPPLKSEFKYGNFVKTNDCLILKFQTTPNQYGNTSYMWPDWMYLPLDEKSLSFHIIQFDGKKMVLDLDKGHSSVIYTFKRTS